MSGYVTGDHAQAALNKGLVLLGKPYTAEALVRAVEEALAGPPGARIDTSSSTPIDQP